MKKRKGMCTRLLLWSLVLLLAVPPGIMAQAQNLDSPTMFRQEELDQMLAPIALYPDELLVQVLMAATYPLEVVQATRWVQAYPNVKGDQLAAALEQQNWDPSVKSLANFPSVLQMMNDNLDWTQKLGDAFLDQQDQVMDTVQQLRQRAQAQGTLRNTSEQRVIVDPQTQEIVVEPVTPQVVYVPVYDPMVVYGPWWWPAYRPYYYHPRGVVIAGGVIGFGIGVALGVAWGYAWGGFNWHRHDVTVNLTRNVSFNRHIDRNRYVGHVTTGSGGQGNWSHDPDHRRGVAYRAPSVAQKYGRGPSPEANTRRDFRGFDQGGAGRVAQGPNRPAVQQPRGPAGPPGQARPEAARQPAGPTQQPQRPAAPPQGRVEAPRQPAGPVQQQPRQTPTPQTRPEAPRQPAGPVQQPGPAAPPQGRAEAPRQPAGPVQQQPRQTPTPQVRPEAPRQQPAAPARQAVQGAQAPAAFGGAATGSQTRQFSNRGHESLGGAPAGGQAPSGNRTSPGGGGSGGGKPPTGGRSGNPRGGR